ncbi:histidine:proton symporter (AAT family) [Tumebacillus sp. BK434]|uniref:amino acid permease n=1 Tax=Tumebacillus sp. BK434 TaxID=2512169 RepID=UPI0010503D10|nr:amino acid permease [Tumebacillus sp. BK434]TCP57574.1 histidine:proton symporter (AAT family) [Tumebacillus sp. BK434]
MLKQKKARVFAGEQERQPKHLKGIGVFSLAGVGIGGVVGAGFLLGSGLAVQQAGPAVVLAFLLGGLVMMQVLGAMTSVAVNRVVPGSFRVHTEQMLGRYSGFLMGWMAFASGILGLGSEALAMGIFSRYWLPGMPLAILATGFMLVVIGLNAFGVENFSKVETWMTVAKVGALLAFVVLGGFAVLTAGHALVSPSPVAGYGAMFPKGWSGMLESMLIVVFCYSGIGAVAMAGTEARDPQRDIPKATWYMALAVILLYVAAMAVLIFVTPWSGVDAKESPFVQAFDSLRLGWASTGMNVIIMIAAFSVMAATYFACMQMLVSLAEAQEAPQFCASKSGPHGRYRIAWLIVGGAGLLIMGLSFVLPPKLFQYLVAASSYFSFAMWALNLLTYLVWLKKRKTEETYHSALVFGRLGAYLTLAAIAVLAGMSLRVADFRMGFYVAAGLTVLISAAYALWARVQSQEEC